jgi:hypothetical protein
MEEKDWRWDFERDPNLEVTANKDEWIALRTSCSCGSADHQLDIFVETDYPEIYMSFYTNFSWSDHYVGRNEKDHRYVYDDIKEWKFIKNNKSLSRFIERIQFYDFWFMRGYRRITGALRILFTGRIDVSHDFIFRDKSHAESLFKGLKSAIEKLESVEKKD